MLARLRSSMAARSLGTHQEESSVPSSSTSPSVSLSVCEEEQVGAPPQVSPPGGPGKPPSPLAAEGGVTRMIGGLEFMKMGERSEELPVVRKGEAGAPVKLLTNYIRLELEDCQRGIWEYEVRFSPQVDSKDDRHRVLRQLREALGPTRTFDGVVLWLPLQLEAEHRELEAEHPQDQSRVRVSLSLKHRKKLGDRSCIQFYNVQFRKIMESLKMVQMSKNYYDPTVAHMVPQHRLEIWPGYVTAVHEYEGGVMLCLDVSHRVLRTNTAYDLLNDVYKKDKDNIHVNAQKALMNSIVLTRYNNKTYKVDDIDFEKNCLSTFIDYNGHEKTFMEYYKTHYGLDIKDPKQPLLISRAKRKTHEEADIIKTVALVPELCTLTGLTEDMKADYKVMKDVALFTRITPAQRQQAMKKFLDNVNSSAEASAHLINWGLRLAKGPVK